MWDLIVSVPDHCLSFYFDQEQFLNQPWVLLDIYDDPNDAMDFFNKHFENVLKGMLQRKPNE